MPPTDIAEVLYLIMKLAGAIFSLIIALVTAGWAFARFVFEPRFERVLEKAISEAVTPLIQRIEAAERADLVRERDIDNLQKNHSRIDGAIETLVGEMRAGFEGIASRLGELVDRQAAQGEDIAGIKGAMEAVPPRIRQPRRKRP